MKSGRGITSFSEQSLNRLLWVGALILALGIPAFGTIYYRGQHIDGGSSLIDRQVQTAEQAVRNNPADFGVRLQLALAYQSANQLEGALKQYQELLRVSPTNRAALLGRGNLLLVKGDLKAATISFKKITGTAAVGEFAGNDPQLAQAYYALGSIALKQGKAREAVAKLEAAVKIESSDADAWYLLGIANMKAGAPELAVGALRRAVYFVPTGWCEPYLELTKVYTKLQRLPEAEYASAMAQFCQSSPAEAKRRLQALVAGPVAIDAMLGLGMIAEASSDREGAIRWYKRVLSTDSKNFNASASLSRLGAEGTG